MVEVESPGDEVFLTAVEYGAKLAETSDGLWVVLDQPEDSLLWLAVFRSGAHAAQAYCIDKGFPFRRDERVPPKFPEPGSHGIRPPHWQTAVWWKRVDAGIHEATEDGHTLKVIYDGRKAMPWEGLVDEQVVCRSQARMLCEQVAVSHVRKDQDHIAKLVSRRVEGLQTDYLGEPEHAPSFSAR